MLDNRLIPARAGNTFFFRSSRSESTAHPRSRGEHVGTTPALGSLTGSSPLARGTLACRSRRRPNQRLIPARAGNTVPVKPVDFVAPAHPRSRGEHEEWLRGGKVHFGSSPLARGTLKVRLPRAPFTRLIPARAGNTSRGSRPTERAAAHPRSRGEHNDRHHTKANRGGSSPLARGTLPVVIFQVPVNRLIPARAGNTREYGSRGSERAAHPRSRGEHSLSSTAGASCCGSSPLARGTLF